MSILLYAVKGHGYRETFQGRPATLFYAFQDQLFDQLNTHTGFMALCKGIIATRRRKQPKTPKNDDAYPAKSGHGLALLDCGEETRTGLMKLIASYLGVPTGNYLAALLEVRKIASLREEFDCKAIDGKQQSIVVCPDPTMRKRRKTRRRSRRRRRRCRLPKKLSRTIDGKQQSIVVFPNPTMRT